MVLAFSPGAEATRKKKGHSENVPNPPQLWHELGRGLDTSSTMVNSPAVPEHWAGHWLEPEDQTSSPSLPLLINRHITAEHGVSQSSYVAWGHTCPSCHLVPWACVASLEQEHHDLWVNGFCCTWAWHLPGKHITSLQTAPTRWRTGILCSPFMPDTSSSAQPAGFSVKSQD